MGIGHVYIYSPPGDPRRCVDTVAERGVHLTAVPHSKRAPHSSPRIHPDGKKNPLPIYCRQNGGGDSLWPSPRGSVSFVGRFPGVVIVGGITGRRTLRPSRAAEEKIAHFYCTGGTLITLYPTTRQWMPGEGRGYT